MEQAYEVYKWQNEVFEDRGDEFTRKQAQTFCDSLNIPVVVEDIPDFEVVIYRRIGRFCRDTLTVGIAPGWYQWHNFLHELAHHLVRGPHNYHGPRWIEMFVKLLVLFAGYDEYKLWESMKEYNRLHVEFAKWEEQ
ncbi:MAG: hypothetical protein SVY53_05185 [Chloroflexota bacterium]|nr:hypothetical protein [Chloroflexota bacterium]